MAIIRLDVAEGIVDFYVAELEQAAKTYSGDALLAFVTGTNWPVTIFGSIVGPQWFAKYPKGWLFALNTALSAGQLTSNKKRKRGLFKGQNGYTNKMRIRVPHL